MTGRPVVLSRWPSSAPRGKAFGPSGQPRLAILIRRPRWVVVVWGSAIDRRDCPTGEGVGRPWRSLVVSMFVTIGGGGR